MSLPRIPLSGAATPDASALGFAEYLAVGLLVGWFTYLGVALLALGAVG